MKFKETMGIIRDFLSMQKRKKEAKKNGVPFRQRMWYNYRAMLPKERAKKSSFIECFNKYGKYIDCPGVGGKVIYNDKGKRYEYKIIGFENESRNRDWLYDTDYINPVVEYLRKIE